MGIVSSIIVHVVISVCWQCRLYVEGDGSKDKTQTSSPGSGFLNTPDATSTPQSPGEAKQTPVVATSCVKEKRPGKSRIHRLSEILSPVEQEMIRVTMARGYGTPAHGRRRSTSVFSHSRVMIVRDFRRGSSRDSIPDVVKRFPGPTEQYTSPVGMYRTRGIRI